MKKAFLLTLTLIATLGVAAQEQWKATIDTVGADGYYNIRLTPQLIGLSGGDNFDDIRILDDKGSEVPYMVRQTVPLQQVSHMKMYPLLQNTANDSLNILLVDNAAQERIGRFYIVMRAADVDKFTSVRGGDQPGQWYVVRQRTPLYAQQGTDGNEVAILDIPEGNYRYYEIALTNAQGSPLSVTGVGKVDTHSIYGQYQPIETGNIAAVQDSLRRTVITFSTLHSPYRIDRLEITVAGNALYHRDAMLTTSGITSGQRSLSLTLSSKAGNIFQADDFPVDSTTRILISNGDNPPLTVDAVHMWTLTRFLCLRLEAGKHYTLMTGAQGRSHYDLEYFRNELNGELPVINTAPPVREDAIATPAPKVRFFEQPAFLWAMMVLAGTVLVIASLQALRVARKQ